MKLNYEDGFVEQEQIFIAKTFDEILNELSIQDAEVILDEIKERDNIIA